MKPHASVRLFRTVLLASVLAACAAAAAPLPAPPTEAQKEAWREHGRDLPAPEVLQPTLDEGLPAFVPRHGRELSGRFKGASSDILTALARRWFEAFKKHYPNVVMDLPPPYAGSLGAIELIKGDLDFALVSRELKPTDVTDFRRRFGYDPLSAAIAGGTWRHFGFLDAVVFIVHEDNPLKALSYDQLDALLSSTRHRGGAAIRTWGQLGLKGEWADRPITIWGIKPWNGFEEFVRQRVLSVGASRGEWRDDINFVPTVFPVSGNVAKDRYALGYAGLAYVGPGVKLLPLAASAAASAIGAGYEEVARADYPLSRLCYINLNKKPGEKLNPALDEFVRFMVSREGQQVVLDQKIFLPLRAAQAAGSRDLLGR